MTLEKYKILVVDDEAVNRKILQRMLRDEYDVIEAENGKEALEILNNQKPGHQISAILLDLIMPVMDGHKFMEEFNKSTLESLPILVVTADENKEGEFNSLKEGAWDFIKKPYQPNILRMRLKNVIIRSKYYLLKQMEYNYSHDVLTGLYNRNGFIKAFGEILEESGDEQYALVLFEIKEFSLYNSYVGESGGNELLKFIAESFKTANERLKNAVFGRSRVDRFIGCIPFNQKAIEHQAELAHTMLASYNNSYYIESTISVYKIENKDEDMSAMLEKLLLALLEGRKNINSYLTYYNPSMKEKSLREKKIVNEMQSAMDEKQFEVYLQPKYRLDTETPYGAEALARWKHPTEGMISPGVFVPLFEKNGFIGKLDFYIWERVCEIIKNWIAEGIEPTPISVNMSRLDMYNKNLLKDINSIVEKNNIPKNLLAFEITESAYIENPEIIVDTIAQLHENGFSVLMDDFGSGYSSLNSLKDLFVDTLKIDMNFLNSIEYNSRSMSILAFVVRMAKWLELPVIMEGVETREQVDFLKSIGCDYIQGYYFGKPMPVSEYKDLICSKEIENINIEKEKNFGRINKEIWQLDEKKYYLINSIEQPFAIYEYEEGVFRTLMVNEKFNKSFGYDVVSKNIDMAFINNRITSECVNDIKEAFKETIKKGTSKCKFPIKIAGDITLDTELNLYRWTKNGNSYLIYGIFTLKN